MATLASHGIRVELPARFEGRIFRRGAADGAATYPVAHFATFPLPAEVADFGGGVTVAMKPTDIFAVLFEYGPESLGRTLFARSGAPTALAPGDFRPYLLRRGVGGQSGTQWFFTENGRPFSFYAVLGSHALRPSLIPDVNALLRNLAVGPPATVGLG